MTQKTDRTDNARRRSTMTAVVLFGVVGGMVGLAFASVPLYQLFCQVTGFGGTPRIAAGETDTAPVSTREVTVSFDSNTDPDLPWQFKPAQRKMTVKIGESNLAHFTAENLSDKPITGQATFNITPFKAAQYFVKTACFCFDEQTLQPGQHVDMPVSFYVDPEIENDINAREVTDITLSYTFFRAEDDAEPDAGITARNAAAAKAESSPKG
jgi:cytochrome c oxidase assembly protein subunit 11